MTRIPLTGGAYQARSVVASAQRCVNLYPESNPQDSQAPVPVTHYPTPGLRLITTLPTISGVRLAYRATNGDLYCVVGTDVYYVDSSFTASKIGVIPFGITTVSMADNGLVICLVDGSSQGWAIKMSNRAFGAINSAAFYGADKVDYIDTYFVFNRPGTSQFYISLSNCTYEMLTGGGVKTGTISAAGTGYTNNTYSAIALTGGTGSGATATITVAGGIVTTVNVLSEGTGYQPGDVLSATTASLGGTGSGFTWTVATIDPNSFDPLDIAAKTGSGDNIVSLYVVQRQLWLIGALTSEVWVNSGAADFTFQALPGLIEHGCAAKYSVAQQDVSLFWLSRDRQGQGVIVQTQGYQVKRISTHAIEAEIQLYPRIDDAIGWCFQQQGHAFYAVTFPTADVTWVYELASGQWHQLAYTDKNGNLRRHRANTCAFAYNLNVVGDWQNGQLYALDPNVFTDNGNPIVRIRSFPHLIDDGNRVTYNSFIADMQVGTLPGSMPADAPSVTAATGPAMVSLRWSDTRGASYGNPMMQSAGAAGEYLISIQWNRLGMARDRVFELSWSAPIRTALNGAFIDVTHHKT